MADGTYIVERTGSRTRNPNAKRYTRADAERRAQELNDAEAQSDTWRDMPQWTVRRVKASRDAWWAL